MSNAPGRKRTLGIAVEGTYGTPASAPTFVVPVLDVPKFEVVQNKVRNTASFGNTYQTNDMTATTRLVNFAMPIKVDEDQLPIFFKQKFTITSALVTGESSVYQHTLAYNSNNGNSYTLFLQDSDRTSQKISGVKFSAINLKADNKEYISLDITGMGQYPTTWTGTNTLVQPKEFVGRHATFNYGSYGVSKTAFSALTAVLNHTFNLSAEDTNFALGSQDMVTLINTEDDFQSIIEALMPDLTVRDDYQANTAKMWDLTITDTARNITGSVANTKPYIQFAYPVGFIESWKESGGLADILKQELTLTPVNRVGVSTAPLQIVVKNAIASY